MLGFDAEQLLSICCWEVRAWIYGKVVIVTGSAGGFGWAIAVGFGQEVPM